MRAEAALIAEISEHPADRQHARQRDQTDDADRDVALGDWQRVGLASLRAREAAIAPARPLATGFTSFSNVQIADTPIAPAPMKRTLRLQVHCASCAGRGRHVAGERGVMRHAPAPANHCADEHRNADRETDQVADRQQRRTTNEKSKPLTAPLPADAEVLRDIAANTCVATMTANTAETIDPHNTASRPARAMFDVGRVLWHRLRCRP